MKLAQNKEILQMSKQTLSQKRKTSGLTQCSGAIFYLSTRLQTIHIPQLQCCSFKVVFYAGL